MVSGLLGASVYLVVVAIPPVLVMVAGVPISRKSQRAPRAIGRIREEWLVGVIANWRRRCAKLGLSMGKGAPFGILAASLIHEASAELGFEQEIGLGGLPSSLLGSR